MKRKAVLMLLMGAVALCLAGCGEDEDVATTTTQEAPEGGEVVVQPVPEGQDGVAPVPRAGETAGGAAGTATDALAQQKTEYVQGAQKMLTNMEQKLTAWQQQIGTQGDQEQQQKVQELSKQAQGELADARAAVDKMRTATGTQLKDAKVAADQAIRDAEAAFKNLQSYVDQTQVTQAQ